MTRILITLILASILSNAVAQHELSGTVYRVAEREAYPFEEDVMPYTKLKLYKDDNLYQETFANIDGDYVFGNIEAGTYTLGYSCLGLKNYQVKQIEIQKSIEYNPVFLLDYQGQDLTYYHHQDTSIRESNITVLGVSFTQLKNFEIKLYLNDKLYFNLKSDAEGHCQLSNIPTGEAKIEMLKDGVKLTKINDFQIKEHHIHQFTFEKEGTSYIYQDTTYLNPLFDEYQALFTNNDGYRISRNDIYISTGHPIPRIDLSLYDEELNNYHTLDISTKQQKAKGKGAVLPTSYYPNHYSRLESSIWLDREDIKDFHLTPAHLTHSFDYKPPMLRTERVDFDANLIACPWDNKKQLLVFGVNYNPILYEDAAPKCLVLNIRTIADDSYKNTLKAVLSRLLPYMRVEDKIAITDGNTVLLEPTNITNEKQILEAFDAPLVKTSFDDATTALQLCDYYREKEDTYQYRVMDINILEYYQYPKTPTLETINGISLMTTALDHDGKGDNGDAKDILQDQLITGLGATTTTLNDIEPIVLFDGNSINTYQLLGYQAGEEPYYEEPLNAKGYQFFFYELELKKGVEDVSNLLKVKILTEPKTTEEPSIEHAVTPMQQTNINTNVNKTSLDALSQDQKWALAILSWGMLMDKKKNVLDIDWVIDLAEQGVHNDWQNDRQMMLNTFQYYYANTLWINQLNLIDEDYSYVSFNRADIPDQKLYFKGNYTQAKISKDGEYIEKLDAQNGYTFDFSELEAGIYYVQFVSEATYFSLSFSIKD